MPDTEDTDQIFIEPSSPNPDHGLGPMLPQKDIYDIWDVALTSTVSENSKRAYLQGMVDFAVFVLRKANRPVPRLKEKVLEHAAPLLTQVKFPLVAEYRDHLREQGYAARTINVRLAAMDNLFKRMMRLDLIEKNPASSELVPRLRTSSISETEALTQEEAERLFKLLYDDGSIIGIRDIAIFSIMIYNGLRRSELVQIDADAIKFINGTPTTKLVIKRGKTISIEFIPLVWGCIEKWLTISDITEGPMFRKIQRTKKGDLKIQKNRLTPDGLYNIIKARVEQAGIKKDIHPHSLRHTYATFALLAGVPIQDVQVSMGHSSTDTTFRYYRAIEQVGRSPGRSIALKWPGSHKGKEKAQ
jgi:site-specific recombinase XerD